MPDYELLALVVCLLVGGFGALALLYVDRNDEL